VGVWGGPFGRQLDCRPTILARWELILKEAPNDQTKRFSYTEFWNQAVRWFESVEENLLVEIEIFK
jgi:hypothetical protein